LEIIMRLRLVQLVLIAVAGTALALIAGSADAFTCYIIFDRADTVVYRDLNPPVDMSAPGARGAAAREQLRLRGQFLMFIETDRCAPLAAAYSSSGANTIEEILAVIPNVGGIGAGAGPPTGFRSSVSTGASSGAGGSTASRSSSGSYK
jgi:hypothetical protein